MVAEWFRAPAISSREEGDVGSSPSPAKIPFSDEFFLNNSRVCWKEPKISLDSLAYMYLSSNLHCMSGRAHLGLNHV